MANDWVGIVETTIRDYIREVEIDVMRNRKWLAMLQARGRVEFNHSGTDMDWKVRYKRGVPKGYADMDTVTFPRRNRHKTAVLDWRGINLSESVSKFDRLKNRGVPAIVKIIETKVDTMMEDVEDFFGALLYIDGNAAGNEKLPHGIESFMGAGAALTNNGFVRTPSDTYAGLSTALANYGGSWSQTSSATDWPDGTGSAEYDFYSPLILDYTHAGWSATTDTWANTCQEVLRYAIIKSRKNKNSLQGGQIDMVLLTDNLYRQFADFQAGKERITIVQGGGNGKSMTSLGFTDVINFEGAEITYEYGVPALTGYGFNIQNMLLASMQETLFVSEGPIENEDNKTLRWSIDFMGNLRFKSPRNFFKLYKFT